MKKIYALLVLVLPVFAFSQTKDYSRYNNSWRLGLNMGAAWQTSDVRSLAGLAGGFTLEKGFLENNTNFFSLAIRGRYLAANTFGSGYNRNYGVKNNDALNGKYDPAVNYFDSVPAGRRYVYDNYKMTLGEGALELQLGFNRLRVQTHVILNLWGGVGITSYRVKTNLKDANGKMYDFSKVDSSGNATTSLSSLRSLYDHSYESDAYGSKGGNIITFSPSCGIGLGYQFSPGFSIIAEYKLTFPQGVNADLLDGKIAPNNDKIAGSKDYYHYAGLNLLFTLRGKKHVRDTSRTAYMPQQPVYTTTVVPATTPVDPLVNVTPQVTNDAAPATYNVPRPIVDFINPASQSSASQMQQYQVTAQVLNVENASQIQVKLNAFSQSNFTFNPQTHLLQFLATLQQGTNFVKIRATNVAGTDSKTVFIDYQGQQVVQPQGNPPQVVITSPATNPFTTSNANYNLFANVYEVPSAAYITVKLNGNVLSNTSYNVTTSQLIVPLNLVDGNNVVEITATNAYGSDSKNTSIYYQRPRVGIPPPVVTFTDPLQNPAISQASTYLVKAQVLNVSSQGQINVSVNGQGVTFSYDNALKQVTIPVNLNMGYNVVTISASNTSGNDSKSATIDYKPAKSQYFPPVISFTQPQPGFTTTSPNYIYRASVQNITSASELKAFFNGVPVGNFLYANNTFEFNAALKPGLNVLTLTATNPDGTDTKSASLTQMVINQVRPPFVTISQPSGNPTVTTPSYAFYFSASNVQQGQLMIKLNGSLLSGYSFVNGQGNFTGNLQPGINTIEVSASNSDGSDSKTATVTYQNTKDVGTVGDVNLALPPAIKFTNPPTSPYDGISGDMFTYQAIVLNITNSSQLQLNFNGSQVGNFSFNPATHQVTYSTTLVPGDNTLSITATNSVGSKQKSATVKAGQRPVTGPTSPSVGPVHDTSIVRPRGGRIRP